MYEDFDDVVVDGRVFDLGPGEAARELLRAQLEADVQRRQVRTPAFRARLRIARKAGISIVDVQRLTGVARQTVYDAIQAPIDSELDELSILALIATGAAQTIEALVLATGARHHRVRRAIAALRGAGYLEVLRSHGDDPSLGVVGISARGLERLQIEVDNERLRSTHADAWTVFVGIPANAQREILAAARKLLGDNESYGLVGAHVSPSTMVGPELAVVVRAPDLREALLLVEEIWTDLRSGAGKRLPATPRIATVSAPTI